MIIYSHDLPTHEHLAKLTQDAFKSPPWEEDLSDTECAKRADSMLGKMNVQCISAYSNFTLVGIILVDELTIQQLKKERGDPLYNWVLGMNFKKIAWGRETLIQRNFQSQGIGRILRSQMISHLENTGQYSVILTRMRDDNFRVIKIAEKFDYKRTGVRQKSSMGENVWHEYWYRTF